jgi:hypothetical protein
VQGSALAERRAQETTGIPAGAVRIPSEDLGLGVSGQRSESKQVSCVDPRQRPIRIRRHAAILSQQLPELSDTATVVYAMCERASACDMATEDDAEGLADGVSKDSKARLTLIWDTNGTQDEHLLHPASTCRSPCSSTTRPFVRAARRPPISTVI